MEGKFGYLYVFQYSYPAILEIELTKEDQSLNNEELLAKHGYKESDCYCMYTENKLEITKITE